MADQKLNLLHRDPARSTITGRHPIVHVDEDAPAAARHEDHTGQVLVDALRSVEKGSDAERALLRVVDLLVSKQGGGDGGGSSVPLVSPKSLRRGFMVVLTVLALVQPTTEHFADRLLSPASALERKLDEMLVQQAALQDQQSEDHSTFIALAKWVVECQMASTAGRSMPEPPAPVRLILVQDELTRTTGQ